MKDVALTNYCAISLLQPACQAAVFSSSANRRKDQVGSKKTWIFLAAPLR